MSVSNSILSNSTKHEKKTHRLTGFLCLLIIICAGFSQGYIRGSIVVPEDAIATANNIVQNEALFRLGLSLDLVAFIMDAIVSVTFYLLIIGKKQPDDQETNI